MRYLYSGAILWFCVMAGCQRDHEIEFVSTSPDGTKRVSVLLERSFLTPKPALVFAVEESGRTSIVQREEIAMAEGTPTEVKTYELGICCAEAAWPSRDVAAVLVKNCLGSVTFVAYDFRDRRLLPGDAYADSMRAALSARYRKELKGFTGDPLRWVQGGHVHEAYRWKRLGNGRLMGGS